MERDRGRGEVLSDFGSLLILRLRGDNGRKSGSLASGPLIKFAFLQFPSQFGRAFGHFPLDLLIQLAKKLTSRPAENCLIRQGGMEARLTIKTLVAADFCPTVSSKEVCDFILGKR